MTFEQKMLDERRMGYKEGYAEGYKEGYADGYKEGYADGYKEGHADGYKEGYAEGQEEVLKESVSTLKDILEPLVLAECLKVPLDQVMGILGQG